jgi:hypothetical protein
MKITEIINKKIVAIRGHKLKWDDKRIKNPKVEPNFIMFDDGETYIELEEQDYYSFHDCSTSARELRLCKNKERWDKIMTQPYYGNATERLDFY